MLNKLLWRIVGVIILLMNALTFQARAESGKQLAPGAYERKGYPGTLTLKKNKAGVLKFDVNTIGGNLHTCSLSGRVKGLVGYVDETAGCKIFFKKIKNGISIASVWDSPNCDYYQYCGTRGNFLDEYFIPPDGCSPNQRDATRNLFIKLYKSKQYEQALNTLSPLISQCKEFMFWVESDRVLNDIAITQSRNTISEKRPIA